MTTKKITKIISTENGDNYVADIEDIENRITQNSSNLETTKQELTNKCNEALSQAKAYTDQEKANLVKKSGDVLTGEQFHRNVNNSSLHLMGGVGWFSGASLQLMGKDNELVPGGFRLDAASFIDNDATKGTFSRLQGTVDGTLTWANKDIERVELKGANYIRYSSGLTFMWGLFGVDTGIKRKTVNLPIPFNSTYNVLLTNQGNNNAYGSNLGYQVVIKSLSTFDIQHTWDGATGWYYLAVGY